jgi:putative ubiquitin-RnfH superfamily antitoxin RatB of RatAB toxin-antitoxin module
LKVTIVWAMPRLQDVVSLDLPEGATVADAVAQSDFGPQYRLDPAALGFSIFGERVGAETPLADGDRVELTRPLLADPKAARARRARAAPHAKPAHRTTRRHRV